MPWKNFLNDKSHIWEFDWIPNECKLATATADKTKFHNFSGCSAVIRLRHAHIKKFCFFPMMNGQEKFVLVIYVREQKQAGK